MAKALQILGYRPAHGELFNGNCGSPPNATAERIWDEWMQGRADFSQPLGTLLERGYDATTADWPLGSAWYELMRRFPEAPVVLTVHPKGVEGWVASLRDFKRRSGEVVTETVLSATALEYVSYNWGVEAACRATGRPFLRFSVAEGWGPLCRFLDLPEPTKPFPHIDEYSGGCQTQQGFHLMQASPR